MVEHLQNPFKIFVVSKEFEHIYLHLVAIPFRIDTSTRFNYPWCSNMCSFSSWCCSPENDVQLGNDDFRKEFLLFRGHPFCSKNWCLPQRERPAGPYGKTGRDRLELLAFLLVEVSNFPGGFWGVAQKF